MGFFDKVKGALNIGGSKLSINGPGTVQNGGTLDFKAVLVGGKMEQPIKDIQVKLVMEETKKSYGVRVGGQVGSAPSQDVKRTTLAQDTMSDAFTIQPGEQKEFSFSLPVNVPSDGSDQGGMMGTLSKLNNMATNKQRSFVLKAVADIEGATDASSKMEIVIQA